MKARINYRSKRTIIIISIAVVLLIAAIAGTVAFVKGNRDSAAAMTDDNPGTSQNDGTNAGLPNNGDQNNGSDQNNDGTTLPTDGDNTNPADSNNNGNNGSTTNDGTTGTNGANGSTTGTTNGTNTGANAGTTTGTTTAGNNGANVPNQDYTQTTTVITENPWETKEIGWSPISVAAYTEASKLKVHKPDLDLQKYAYLDGDSLEELPVNTAVQKGETINYVIKITNKGNEDANGIRTIDSIPEGTELASISEGGALNNDGKIVWKNNIKAGETVTVSFKVVVTADSIDLINNIAKVNGEETPETKTPVITANKTAQVVTKVDKEEVLENRDAKVGETIRYTITAKNTTEVDGTTVIKDSIPDGTTFVDGSIKGNGNFDKENGTITWNNVVVPAKGEVSVSFDVVVNKTTKIGEEVVDVKSVSNTATVGNTPTEEVETKVANITTVKTSEGKHADGTLVTKENPLHELDKITYTLTAKNDGEGKGTVKISDTIPTGTTLVGSIELDGKSYTKAELNAGIDVTLEAGEEKSIAFTVKINPFETEKITVRNADAKQDGTEVPPTDDEVVKEYVTITVTKKWNEDNDKQTQKRPSYIRFELYAENESDFIESHDMDTSKNDPYTFAKQPKYNSDGEVINYTVQEKEINENDLKFYNSTFEVDGDGNGNKTFNFINTFVVPDEKNPIEVTKVWDDNNDAAGKRSTAKAELVLTGNNKEYSHEMIESDKKDANTYKYTFGELPKYDANGDEIKYVLGEKDTGSIFYTMANATINQNTMTVTNKFVVPDEKNSITVTKIWNDNVQINGEDKKGPRPDTINIVFKGGKKDIDKKLTGTGNTWSESYSLPKYDENGNPITYTIDEKSTSLDWYVKSIDQEKYTITNSIPDLEITKKIVSLNGVKLHDNTEVSVVEGDVIGYEITVENIGNVDLTNVTVVDEMTNGNAIYENYDKTTNTVSNKIKDGIVAVIPELKTKSEPVSYLVYYKVTSTDVSDSSKSIDNTATATVKYTDVTGKEKEIDRFDEASAQVQDISKIEVEKTQSVNGKQLAKDEKNTKVTPGTVINYTIKVRNAGNTKQENVIVTDTMNNLSKKSYEIKSITVNNTVRDYTITEDGIAIGDLEIGEEAVITITYTVDESDMTTTVGEIKNTVTVNKTNPDETTPTDEVKVPTEEWKADINVVKSSKLYRDGKEISGPAMYGDTIRYTIKATNTGNKAGTVVVKDTAPTGTTPVESDIYTAISSEEGYTLSVSAHDTASVSFDVTVTGKPSSTITNTATVDGKDAKDPDEHTVEKKVSVKMNTQTPTIKNSNVVIVLDVSGSMADDSNGDKTSDKTKTRLYAAKQACKNLIDGMFKNGATGCQVSVVTFSSNYKWNNWGGYYNWDNAKTLGSAKDDKEAKTLKGEIDDLTADGGTRIAAGLKEANTQINKLAEGNNNKNIVIVLSDGDFKILNDKDGTIDETGGETKKRVTTESNNLKNSACKPTVYAVAFASKQSGLMENTIATPADKNNTYFKTASDYSSLLNIFTEIGTEIGEGGNVDVISNNGLIELPGIDVNKDITIKLNGETTGTTGKIDSFGEKIKKIDGEYYLDTSKFDADAKIEIEYFEVESNN